MSESVKVLFINSEILPYLPETKISGVGRYLPQAVQESGREIRTFMPRYGVINERRNQLHEVIRLSGLNIIVKDIDRPLIIKVASISAARMQVYFIDNEDYFHRKLIYNDESGKFLEDNDERAVFFARGVLETVKKLRWKPDIVHCQGWMSQVVPVYLKKVYKNDPIFSDAKIVLSLYDEIGNEQFSPDFKSNILVPGLKEKDLSAMESPDGINLAKLAIQHSDGVILGDDTINPEIKEFIEKRKLPALGFQEITKDNFAAVQEYNNFYDTILKTNAAKD